MPYDTLTDFLAELEDDGDLVRVPVEVDAAFEIAEIAERVCKIRGGGPALLFEQVRGRSMPVVVNLLGSERRMCRALGAASFDEVAARIVGLVQPDLPAGWLEALRLVPQFAQLTKLPPRVVKTGLCQQVVKIGRDVDLRDLPILQSWPDEAGPVITLGQVYTKSPQTGLRNVGLYPLQVRDPKSLTVHWTVHQGGHRHFAEYQREPRQMPVAVALGGDPIYAYMAHAPLPAHTDECVFGGFLRGRNIDLVKCRTIELEVPAEAEIVIEGFIDAEAKLEPAGAVAGATGFYSLPDALPVMQVTAVTHRSNPVYPAMIYGRPPMEDYWLNKACERIFLPLVRLFVPELVDLHWPRAGAFRNILFASIRKEYPQQARKVMNALWSLAGLMTAKLLVIVDADVDVHDEERVWFAAGANVHPGRDVVIADGPTHMTDHAAPVRGMGQKLGLDATRKRPEEGHPRPWPDELVSRKEIRDLVSRRWRDYGITAARGESARANAVEVSGT